MKSLIFRSINLTHRTHSETKSNTLLTNELWDLSVETFSAPLRNVRSKVLNTWRNRANSSHEQFIFEHPILRWFCVCIVYIGIHGTHHWFSICILFISIHPVQRWYFTLWILVYTTTQRWFSACSFYWFIRHSADSAYYVCNFYWCSLHPALINGVYSLYRFSLHPVCKSACRLDF